MSRYVILEHDHPVLHWDFMLESGRLLRTWRLESLPAPGKIIAATALGDHRLAYLDYEGPLSGNRGTVTQWDSGEFKPVKQTDEHVEVRLHGRRLNGTATLERAGATWLWRWTAE